MYKILLILIASFINTSLSAQQVPTVQAVIEKYNQVLGGKEKLDSVKTSVVESTLQIDGQEFSSITKKKGNKMLTEISFKGQVVNKVIFNGEKGYSVEMGVKTNLSVEKTRLLKKGNAYDALNYESYAFEQVNEEKIDGKTYFILSTNNNKFYFDKNTGLLYKLEVKGLQLVVSSYITVEGIKFPENTEMTISGKVIPVKYYKILINTDISDKEFQL